MDESACAGCFPGLFQGKWPYFWYVEILNAVIAKGKRKHNVNSHNYTY